MCVCNQTNVICIHHRGRQLKPIKNLKADEEHLDLVLNSQEMQFTRIQNMEAVILGATVQDCDVYKENVKRGYLIKEIPPIMGTDGKEIYVAVIYAKYPNQTEYQTMNILMEDVPKFAREVAEHTHDIQSALQSIVSSFSLEKYFQKLNFVKISHVKCSITI